MNVLSLNTGSSSLKFALSIVNAANNAEVILTGLLDRLGTAEATLTVTQSKGSKTTEAVPTSNLSDSVKHAIKACSQLACIDAVGCRVVHGGSKFREPVVIDADILCAIRDLSPLAPLHTLRAVETMEAAQKALPNTSVVAVFDTGFHQTLPAVASTYALPANLREEHHLQRYGFHGISYRYVANKLIAKIESKASKLVICHLGSGASVCAVLNGESIDTSMGLTPLEGLVMGTRSGDIDPGLVLFLQRELGMSFSGVDKLLNQQSGLLGLSGVSADVRALGEAASNGNAAAELALEVFSYRVAKYIGSYAVSLEGIQSLAFCGGIGENSADIRHRICRRLKFLGVELDSTLNDAKICSEVTQIDASSAASVWVVKTDEERQIANETFSVLTKSTVIRTPDA